MLAETPFTTHVRSDRRTAPAEARKFAWWLAPHLLGLDAAVVAVIWQDWWSRSARVPLLPGERAVLGLGVWLIYLADRLADNARRPREAASTARHAFAATYQRPLLGLAAVVLGSLIVLAPRVLPSQEFRGGLGMLAVATLYFWLIHRGRAARWTRHLPKEAVVGGMFALGTAFFAIWKRPDASVLLVVTAALFGVVCFLNCALITSWERDPHDRRDPASLLNAFPGLVGHGLPLACWLTALLAIAVAAAGRTTLPLPIALAAVALAMLDHRRRYFSEDALRCLVDVVLLTPCVCLLCAAVFL